MLRVPHVSRFLRDVGISGLYISVWHLASFQLKGATPPPIMTPELDGLMCNPERNLRSGFALGTQSGRSGDYVARAPIHKAQIVLPAEGQKTLLCIRFLREAIKPEIDNDSLGLTAV